LAGFYLVIQLSCCCCYYYFVVVAAVAVRVHFDSGNLGSLGLRDPPEMKKKA
jgi:hypothetical protein